ncbi:hypothetical protein KUTeg_004129 [Tegillarca granosa]|uniref:TRPM SLOG domain-containing protein n=1 Tax=Tegillarca granosa TaxID=220873 RepID=A0ABQ9FP35_TEGGR|nr:hypothetical protein KUTeg_004129 [Tegillarca granosa]
MNGFSDEKGFGDPPPEPVRRELSDAYLESLSRTPRYERCNTYDEMLEKVAEGDPFHGEYKPSDKPKRAHQHKSKKKDENLSGNVDPSISGDIIDDVVKKKHKKKKKKESSPTREITPKRKVNPVFEVVDADAASVKSTGTYVLEKRDLDNSQTDSKPPSIIQETETFVRTSRGSTSQVASGLGRRRTKLGIDKGASRFSGLFPAVYSQQDVAKIPGREIPIDHNHTHFLLVDDGSIGNHSAQGAFKANLEQFISSQVYMQTADSKCQDVNVPVVTILIEGGIKSISNTYESVKRNTPVLILEGSGRACEYVAYAYKLTVNPSK